MSARDKTGVQWLLEELPGLVAQGVLSSEAATSLEGHYRRVVQPGSSRNVGLALSAILGAILIGGGISLLIAHNWDMLSRDFRAAIAFAILALTQALAFFVLWRQRDSVAWRESAGILNFAAIGGAIAIISQAYQIQGSLSGYILTWILLSVGVAYALRSTLIGVLYIIGCAFWVTHLDQPTQSAGTSFLFWLWLGLIVPFAVSVVRPNPFGARAVLLLLASAIALSFGLAETSSVARTQLWTASAAGLCATIYLAGCIWQRERRRMHVMTALGFIGIWVLAIIFSYEFAWRDGHYLTKLAAPQFAAVAMLSLILVSPYLLVAWSRAKMDVEFNAAAVAFPLVVASTWAIAEFLPQRVEGSGNAARLCALLMIGYGLFFGIWTLRRGVRRDRLLEANLGMLLLAVLALFRFFDDEFSFLARGIGFIVVGSGFLAANLLILRRRRAVASP